MSQQLSKADSAYQSIREKIISQDLAPGHRLTLSSLAKELTMSVVPVREAIRRLEAEGLVSFERNIGARVAMIDEGAYSESMNCLSLLEGAATAQAAAHLTSQDLQEAEEINQQLEVLLEDFDPATFTALNRQFHQKLFSACPNTRLLDLLEAEWDRLGNLRESTFSFVPNRAAQSVAEHYSLLDLITRQASPEEIEGAARRHRQATLKSYLSKNSS
ncbi:MAG: GntR family transcriptional regulator [Rothia sp. (in: high G+C Gram-positive bacteria)]|nr:GntR family transcriptional regulator [Rothia sp. (in: high G+C Gram-positive bacteria)]